ncbi:MAG: helix-turn-helix transcriptional regulator, partial [Xanthobacteraceae bacterium]|nr:helix-turn-helix transcriptional regulator [Xanthobacteraceae bacterium]
MQEESGVDGSGPEQLTRGDRKRQAILKGAKEIFLKRGFGGASMDAVASAAGVSKMTVYRHFHNKEELFAGL